jgi:tRNA (guanine-N7-)-methyltransferase
MRVRVRNHVNPLGAAFVSFRDRPLELPATAPVEVEIGCADAQFLFERAARDPGRRYVGLEIREELVRAVNRQAEDRRAPVRAVFCNANRHLCTIFSEHQVDRVYVNFPDPWFKRRHHKRRLVDLELARAIATVLRPGGELFFQSDVWSLALESLAVFESVSDLLENRAGQWSFWKGGNPYAAQSWRERQCERRGLPIWRLRYRRRPLADAASPSPGGAAPESC